MAREYKPALLHIVEHKKASPFPPNNIIHKIYEAKPTLMLNDRENNLNNHRFTNSNMKNLKARMNFKEIPKNSNDQK